MSFALRASFLRSLPLLLTVAAPARAAEAGDTMTFANCHQAEHQLGRAVDVLSVDERERLFHTLYSEVLQVEDETKKFESRVPKGYLKRCRDTKREAFFQVAEKGQNTIMQKPAVLFKLAKFYNLQANLEKAVGFYETALELDPHNAIEATAYFGVWARLQRQSFKTTYAKALSVDDVKRYIDKAHSILERIIGNVRAEPRVRIQALEMRAQFYRDANQIGLAVEDWKRLIELDAYNKPALEALAAWFLNRGDAKSAVKYLRLLAKLEPVVEKVYFELGFLLLAEKQNDEALQIASRGLKKFPSSLKIKQVYVSALIRKDRLEEAARLADEILKVAPKDSIAFEAKSRLNEREGDRWAEKKMWGNALKSYRQAQNYIAGFSPEAVRQLGTKRAYLIFEYRKSEKFDGEASAADMTEVVALLNPLVKEGSTNPRLLETVIEAGAQSTQPAAASAACQRALDESFQAIRAERLLQCSKVFRQAGKKSTAQDLLKRILATSRMQSVHAEAKRELAEMI